MTTSMSCDECQRTVEYEGTLPSGWVSFRIEGWAGEFHACSTKCEEAIRKWTSGEILNDEDIIEEKE